MTFQLKLNSAILHEIVRNFAVNIIHDWHLNMILGIQPIENIHE